MKPVLLPQKKMSSLKGVSGLNEASSETQTAIQQKAKVKVLVKLM